MLGKEFHGVVKATLQEVFRHLQALQLVHGLHLLFALATRNIESLVLLLDARNFAFDLLNPLVMCLLLTFMVLRFELANFFEFSLFFYLQKGLLD